MQQTRKCAPIRQRMKWNRSAALIAVATALVVAGCGTSNVGTGSSASGAKGVPWTTVILGQPLSPPKVPQQAAFVAQAEGFFAKEHLQVKIDYMPNGLASELGTTAGSIHIGMAGGSDSIEAAAQGAPIKAIWADYPPLDLVCIGGPKITTVHDLVGKNVGTTGPGGFAATTLAACLQNGGGSLKQVNEISMERAQFVPALATGRIQAAVFHADDAYTVLHSVKGLHILNYLYKTIPLYWNGSLNARNAFATSNKSEVVRTIAALMLANRWMMNPSNNAAFVRIAVADTHESSGAVQYAIHFDRSIHFWNTSCAVPSGIISYTTQLLIKEQAITHSVNSSQVYDGSYCEAALKLIGSSSSGG